MLLGKTRLSWNFRNYYCFTVQWKN